MTIAQISTFNPVTEPEGAFTVNVSGNCITIHLLNESLTTFLVKADDGRLFAIVPALWASTFSVVNGPNVLVYSVIANQNAEDTTLQEVQGAAYDQNEDTSKLYSGPLPRIANVGNPTSVSQNSTVSLSDLANTGNPVGTQILQTLVSGYAADSWDVFNDAQMTMKALLNGVMTIILQNATNIPGSPTGSQDVWKIGAANYVVEVMGKLLVDQLFTALAGISVTGNSSISGQETVGGTIIANGGINTNTIRDDIGGTVQATLAAAGITLANLLTANGNIKTGAILENTNGTTILSSAGVNTHIGAPTGDQILADIGGVNAVAIDATGIQSQGSKGFIFPSAGFLPNLSFFTGTGSGTYSHGFGASPFWVCPITQVAGSATQGYDTVTSTQVHVTLGAANSFKAACL